LYREGIKNLQDDKLAFFLETVRGGGPLAAPAGDSSVFDD
jgi:hypothetical protein